MRINTNISSLSAQAAAANVNKNLSSSLEKLSTGLRINKASDDASGMAIADKLRTQASSLAQGIANANSANTFVQIADKAMAEQSNILDIVKTKLMQATTSTTSADGRASILNDIKALLTQLDSISTSTNYNGTTLLDGSNFSFQIGELTTDKVDVNTSFAAKTSNLGGGSNTVVDASTSTTSSTANSTIAASNSVMVSTDGTINLSSTNASDVMDKLDVTVSGKIGVIASHNSNMTIDISSESDEVKAAVEALAGAQDGFARGTRSATSATIDTNTSGNVYTIDLGTSVDFKNIDFNSAILQTENTKSLITPANDIASSENGGSINITAGSEKITVKNNDVATTTDTGSVISMQLKATTGDAETSTLDVSNMTAGSFASVVVGGTTYVSEAIADTDADILVEMNRLIDTVNADTKTSGLKAELVGTENSAYKIKVTGLADGSNLVMRDLALGANSAAAQTAAEVAAVLDATTEAKDTTNDISGGNLLDTLKGLDTLSASDATTYLTTIDAALTQLNTVRGEFGSAQNQVESALRNMTTTQVNVKAAESIIRDVDYASESANFNKQNIIAQAGTYAISQANAIQQNVLRLLQ